MSSIGNGTSWWESGPRGLVPANVRKWVNISGVSGIVCGTAVILLGLFAARRTDLVEVIIGALIVPTWLYLALWVRHLGPESSRRLRGKGSHVVRCTLLSGVRREHREHFLRPDPPAVVAGDGRELHGPVG